MSFRSDETDVRPTRFRRAHVLWWPWRPAPTVYLPPGLAPPARDRVVRHERVHVGQWTALGRARFLWRYLTDVWAGLALAVGAALWTPWLLLAVPVAGILPGLKEGRIELEAEAFADSVRWWRERGVTPLVDGRPVPALEWYAGALRNGYGLGPMVSRERCAAAIASHLGRG